IVATLWALGPTATAARLAEREGISERTLHRRLARAGTSFRAEIDAIRRRFAAGAGDRSAEELAILLGYSDARAYRRRAPRGRRGGGPTASEPADRLAEPRTPRPIRRTETPWPDEPPSEGGGYIPAGAPEHEMRTWLLIGLTACGTEVLPGTDTADLTPDG